MKRPEGFDPRPEQPAAPPARSPKPPKLPKPPQPAKISKTPRTAGASRTAGQAGAGPGAQPIAKPTFHSSAQSTPQPTARPIEQPTDSRAEQRQSARAVRKAAAVRRRFERSEVKRFTRRSRRRRITWLVVLLCFVAVGGLVTGAVYSPVLSLKTIEVTGTSRVDKAEVLKAVDGQLGTPLALVDFDAIKKDLSRFPLIRSYVTESVPPDTLIIRIAERAPIAVIETPTGFEIVDPAGVVIKKTDERPAGLPLITLPTATTGAATSSMGFTSAVKVLLALPTELLAKVDSVTAQTLDNVTLVLSSGPTVVWGSADESAKKARILAILIANEPQATRFDVSAPTIPTFAN
ncbi:MAG: FtsQ-type POTRA domain-containing protein [Lacisediminihabitans sp.]